MDTWRKDNINSSDTDYRHWADILNASTIDWNVFPLSYNVVAIPISVEDLNSSFSPIPSNAWVIQNAGQEEVKSHSSIGSIIYGVTTALVLIILASWAGYHRKSFLHPPPPRTGHESEDLLTHEDFTRLLREFYLGTETRLELAEKDLLGEGVDISDVETVMELLRRMYSLDERIWARSDSGAGKQKTVAGDRESVEELKRQSDEILAEVKRIIASWGVPGRTGLSPTSRWQEDEKNELGVIVNLVGQMPDRRYPE